MLTNKSLYLTWTSELGMFLNQIAYIDRGPPKICARAPHAQEQPWPFLYSQVLSSFSLLGPGEALCLPESKMQPVMVNTPRLPPGPCLLRLTAAPAPNPLASLDFFHSMQRQGDIGGFFNVGCPVSPGTIPLPSSSVVAIERGGHGPPSPVVLPSWPSPSLRPTEELFPYQSYKPR